MPAVATSQVIDALVREAPAILDRHYNPDRCIAATWHGIEVCRYFGIEARALKTQAVAGNQAWYDWLSTQDDPVGPMPDEAWSVGIDISGEKEEAGRYPGHLVMITEDDSLLVDLSLGQMARPQHGMSLPRAESFAVPSWKDFEERGAVYAITDTETDAVAWLHYRPLPEKDWTSAPDWKRKPPLAGALIRKIREELDS